MLCRVLCCRILLLQIIDNSQYINGTTHTTQSYTLVNLLRTLHLAYWLLIYEGDIKVSHSSPLSNNQGYIAKEYIQRCNNFFPSHDPTELMKNTCYIQRYQLTDPHGIALDDTCCSSFGKIWSIQDSTHGIIAVFGRVGENTKLHLYMQNHPHGINFHAFV